MARFWRRSPAKSRVNHSRRALGQKPKLTRWSGPFLELLEDRTLLSFSAHVSGTSVAFTSSNITDTLYLQTDPNSGHLEWQDNSNSGTWTDLGFIPGNGGATTVLLEVYNPVVLQTVVGAGGDLTFEGESAGNSNGAFGFIGPSQVSVNGNIHTEGGDLTIQYAQALDVGANVVVSTRQLASYSSLTPGQEQNNPSTGNAGAITLSVGNLDPLNQILNINFQTPQINLNTAALVLANTTTTDAGGHLVASPDGYSAGEVNFSATNESWNMGGLGLLGGDLSLLAREADIYVDQNAVIRGNDVTLSGQGGDVSAIETGGTAAATGAPTNPDQETDSQQTEAAGAAAAIGGVLATGLATLVDKIPALKSILSPSLASFMYKDGTAHVEVKQGAQIIADGNVTMSATADSFAYGQASNTASGLL